MADSVSLPFSVPYFASTHASAAPGLAMAGHPTAYNGYLSQCITISCSRRFLNGYSSPEIMIPKSNIVCFNFIERYVLASRFAYPYYREFIKKMLNEGFYIYYSGVDDFYLPGKSWYGTRHMNHDGIICGYDDDDQTYSIAAYDIDWVFNLIRIPQDCYMEGLFACLEKEQYGSIVAYKIKDVEVKLDDLQILKGLKTYLKNTIDFFSLEEQGRVSGIAVHDFLAIYMDKLKDGSITMEKMDWRVLRPVWEYKRCMLDRIKAIEEKREWDTELSSKYAPLVEDANRLRMMYAMYQNNQKQSLLDKIKNGILSLKDKETEILQDLINRMEEQNT